MPLSSGFNHVATVTGNLDRIVDFYREVFDAKVTLEIAARDDHPRMAIVDLGGDAALNVFEQQADTIVGDRKTAGSRGPIDHFAVMVPSRADLDTARDRLLAVGADIGEIHQLGDVWSLFFRDPDGMELEVCTPVRA